MRAIDQLKQLACHIDHKRRLHLGGVFVLTLVASAAEIISIGALFPFLVALISKDGLANNSALTKFLAVLGIANLPNSLLIFSFIFAFGAIFAGLSRYALMWYQTRLSFAIGGDLCTQIYRSTLYQPYVVHLSRNSSEILAAITTKVRDVINQIIGPCITLTSSFILLISISFFLLSIDPRVASISFVLFGGVYFVIALMVKRRLVNLGMVMSSNQNKVMQILQEGLIGIREVLLGGSQEFYVSLFNGADRPARDATAKIIVISQAPRYAIEAIGMVLIIFIAYLLVEVMGEVTLVLPILGALALGAQRMLPLLQQSYWSYSQIHGGQSSLADILVLLNQPIKAAQGDIESICFEREIVLRNISFAYSSDRPQVLKNVSLCIDKGSCIGIVGGTGGGKSTLVDILTGLISPDEGCLEIDGTRIDWALLEGWQSQIAHVPQTIYLADTTIAQNIAFGVSEDKIDLDRVRNVARQAQIADVIESWEDGYLTNVGEQGVRLSGGQRQRIGIARALYKDANLIIFDEATSALDQETEKTVMREIRRFMGSRTLIIIAHRLSTLEKCDSIFEVKDGMVINLGSYKNLSVDA